MLPRVEYNEQYEIARSFAEMWAEGVLRQAERYRSAHDRARVLDRQYEHMEDWSPPWSEVQKAFDVVWVEAHLLVVATHQLTNWTRRMAEERGGPTPAEDTLLGALRNSIEHLDEADLSADAARPNPAISRKRWSLKSLPGGALPLGMNSRTAAFDLLDVNTVEQRCRDVIEQVFNEVEQPQIDAYLELFEEERRGK